jgi:hypothetical protein
LRPEPSIITTRNARFFFWYIYLSSLIRNLTVTSWVMISVTLINLWPDRYCIMMHNLHKCIDLHGNLEFSCLLTIRFCYPLIFNFSFVVSVNIFCNPVLIFYLDKQHLFLSRFTKTPFSYAKSKCCWISLMRCDDRPDKPPESWDI